jgi:hypothetical protein
LVLLQQIYENYENQFLKSDKLIYKSYFSKDEIKKLENFFNSIFNLVNPDKEKRNIDLFLDELVSIF